VMASMRRALLMYTISLLIILSFSDEGDDDTGTLYDLNY